jgi:hypothetical protein
MNEKVSKQLRRKISASRKRGCEFCIQAGGLYKRRKSLCRHARAAIANELAQDLLISPTNQNVCDRFRYILARGKREQVLLGLLSGNIREVRRLEPGGVLKRWPRHGDVIVHGKVHHDPGRRVADGSEQARKLNSRCSIYETKKPLEDLPEQPDMLAVEAGCFLAKKPGDAEKGFGSPRGRAVFEHLIQLRQEQGGQ